MMSVEERSSASFVNIGCKKTWKQQLFHEVERHTGGDVTLVAGDIKVSCHASVLAAGSPLIRDLLVEQFREGEGEYVVHLSGWDKKALELAMQLLYTGEILLKSDQREVAESVVNLMSMLGVQGVEVGPVKCFRCNDTLNNLGDYIEHLDSEHGAQTTASIDELMKELRNPDGDPYFDDWTCMGCFATDLLPVKKSELVDTEEAVTTLEKHVRLCGLAVEMEKERVARMQGIDINDNQPSPTLGSILNANLWSVCPLCGDYKENRSQMTTHLIWSHPQLLNALENSIVEDPPFTCEDGCDSGLWKDKRSFAWHKFKNCKTGGQRRFQLFLNKIPKSEILPEDSSDYDSNDSNEGEESSSASKEGQSNNISTAVTMRNQSYQTSVNSPGETTVESKVFPDTSEREIQTIEVTVKVAVDQESQTLSVNENCGRVVNQNLIDRSCQTDLDDGMKLPTRPRGKNTPEKAKQVLVSSTNDHIKGNANNDAEHSPLKPTRQNKKVVGESSVKFCSQCHGIFETTSKYKSKIKHFCRFLGGKLKHSPTLEVGANSGAKRITLTCTLCRFGDTRRKPVFQSDEDLLLHILLSHKARYIKNQIERGTDRIPGTPHLPAPCALPGCEENLQDWEQAVVHVGLHHEKLFYALQHSAEEDYKHIMKRFYPEKYKKVCASPMKVLPVPSKEVRLPGKAKSKDTQGFSKLGAKRRLNTIGTKKENGIQVKRRKNEQGKTDEETPIVSLSSKDLSKLAPAAHKGFKKRRKVVLCDVCPPGHSVMFANKELCQAHMAESHFKTWILDQYPAEGSKCGFPDCSVTLHSAADRAKHLGLRHKQVLAALQSHSLFSKAKEEALEKLHAQGMPAVDFVHETHESSKPLLSGRLSEVLDSLQMQRSLSPQVSVDSGDGYYSEQDRKASNCVEVTADKEADEESGKSCQDCGGWLKVKCQTSKNISCDAYNCGQTFHCVESLRKHQKIHKWGDF